MCSEACSEDDSLQNGVIESVVVVDVGAETCRVEVRFRIVKPKARCTFAVTPWHDGWPFFGLALRLLFAPL